MLKNCKLQKGLFQLAKECRAMDVIGRIVAFQPPKQTWYTIGQSKITEDRHNNRFEKVTFIHDLYPAISYPWIEQDCYIYKKKSQRSKSKINSLVVLHLRNTSKRPGGFTILLSHGNASTLGTIYSLLYDLSIQLKCDIIAYDYSGYGQSSGKPSEKEIYSDIEEVGYFIKEILNIPMSSVILLGHSIGSAPSVYLSITPGYRDVLGMILISPIASGIKLVSPGMETKDLENIDVFCNLKKVSDVQCPIFLIHGERDDVIPIQQSIEMAQHIRNPYEWHPRNGDHCNILTKYRTKFLQKTKIFFEFLTHFSKKENVSQNSKGFKDNNNTGFVPFRLEENYISNLPKEYEDGNKNENEDGNERNQNLTGKANSNLISVCNPQFKFKFPNKIISESECPFEDHEQACKKVSEPEAGFATYARESGAVVLYQKDLEEEYYKMVKKHNGL